MRRNGGGTEYVVSSRIAWNLDEVSYLHMKHLEGREGESDPID